MSAHVLLNLLNDFEKEIKGEACRAFYRFFYNFVIIYNVRNIFMDVITFPENL